MKITRTGKRFHLWYDSIADLIADVTSRQVTPAPNDGGDENHKPEEAWDCNAGWNGALRLARDGWQLPNKHLPTKGVFASPHGHIEFSECGDEVDAGLYVAGEPECFIHRVGECPMRIERLFVACNYLGGFDANMAAKNAALMWQWLLDCHSRGIDVEVSAVRINCDDHYGANPNTTVIPLRHAGDPLESHQFMAAFHPAFFRRLIFRSSYLHCFKKGQGNSANYPEVAGKAFRDTDISGQGIHYTSIDMFNPMAALEELPTL